VRYHIYYHMDADGHASAGIIQEYLERTQGPDVDIQFQPINYGMSIYTNNIRNGDTVYMVDFCLQPDEDMWAFNQVMLDRKCVFVWIDHHATVAKTLGEYPGLQKVLGIRHFEKRAACELTWEYMYEDSRQMPKIISLIGDWDTWRKENKDSWENLVVPLQAYLRYERSDPKHNRELWPYLLRTNQDDLLSVVRVKGEVLVKYQRQLDDAKMRGFARKGKFAGYSALVINSPQVNSSCFERMRDYENVDLGVSWVYTKQGQFSVSIYPTKPDIDAGALCKKLAEDGPYKSGGGHAGAAGFQTDAGHLFSIMQF
jgi:hypothetical protein